MLFTSIWDSLLAQGSVLLLCQYTATLRKGGGTWFIYAKLTIPEFPEIFPGIDLVSIIYVRYYSAMFIDEEYGKLKVVVDGG